MSQSGREERKLEYKMSKTSKLKIGFAGARFLGVECLKFINKRRDVKIAHVCFPSRTRKVWWKDVVDEDEVERLGLKITPWEKWDNLKFDLVFSVLHDRIFKKHHIENAKYGIVNLHTAKVPEYRGCNVFSHSIMNGEIRHGLTLHYVDEGIDSGSVVSETSLSIRKEDTAQTLYDRAQKKAAIFFKKIAPKIIDYAKKGRFHPAKSQDETRANYYDRDSLSNKEVSLDWNKEKLYNFVRAVDFPPLEPAYILVGEKKVYLTVSKLKKISINGAYR